MRPPDFTISKADQDCWWRAEVHTGPEYNGNVWASLNWRRFIVVRSTPKGVWLREEGLFAPEKERFVRGDARLQFAVPTKRLALKDAEIRARHELAYKLYALKHAKAKNDRLKELVKFL